MCLGAAGARRTTGALRVTMGPGSGQSTTRDQLQRSVNRTARCRLAVRVLRGRSLVLRVVRRAIRCV